MHNISRFSKTEIEQVLSTTKRQYFVGNINLPQKLNHIEDSNLEIGITYYEKSTTEIPHYHQLKLNMDIYFQVNVLGLK